MASTVQSLFGDMFKSPAQMVQEQQQKLIEQGRQSAGMMLAAAPQSGLARAIAGHAAGIAQNIPATSEAMRRATLGAAGLAAGATGQQQVQEALYNAAMTPEERAAAETQKIVAETDQTNLYSVKKAIEKFKAAGNAKGVMFMQQKLEQLQQRNLDRASTARAEQRAITEARDKSRLVEAQLQQIEQANTDKSSQQQALQAMLPEIDSKYMSDGMKSLVKTLEPKDGIALVRDAQAKQVAAAKLAQFNKLEANVLNPTTQEGAKVDVKSMDAGQINERYQKLIRAAKESGLASRAEQLESERQAVLKNKTDIRGIEEDLRKGFRKDATAATQREVVDQARKGIKFLETGEGAGDIAGIITYMKSLDPGSVVREGEFATAASVGGLIDSLGATFEGWKEGDRLTDKQRQELAKTMQVAAQVAAESYNTFRGSELDAYTGRGYDGTYIVGDALVAPSLGDIATTANDATNVPDEDVGALFGETTFKRY